MSALVANILASALLPPFCLILMGGIGVAMWRRRPRLGRNLAGASLLLLWVVSTSAFNIPLLEVLGWPTPADPRAANGAQAIVVLGGGISIAPPEYGGADTVNSRTLDRVRYAAWLSRQTRLPVLASGGRSPAMSSAGSAEGELMKSVLENEFATPVRWIEVESTNTFENARASARILREAGIGKVFLVTDALHMHRALHAFAPTGIEVIPAPIHVRTGNRLMIRDFLPGPVGIADSYYIAHELVGLVWYAIRERFE